MAVVPYSQQWQVILSQRRIDSNGDALVLFNAENRQVAVLQTTSANNSPIRSSSNVDDNIEEPHIFCPYCKRPFSPNDENRTNADSRYYMDTAYFTFLEAAFAAHARPSGSLPAAPAHSHGILSQESLNSGYYSRFFKEERKLGSGSRGSVFLCTHVLDGIALSNYAVKKVPIGNDRSWLVRMLQEVRLLERLRHPNIVQYNHVWIEDGVQLNRFGPPVSCLMILMEYCNGGDLESYVAGRSERYELDLSSDGSVRRRRKSLAESLSTQQSFLNNEEISDLFFQITRGLHHLHSHNILHRDLKAQNVLLLFEEDSKKPRAIISDFGEGQIMAEQARRRTGGTGTIEWSAPEVIFEFGGHFNDFTTKADIWSLGMILHYLIYQRLPFSQVENVEMLRQEIFTYNQYNRKSSGLDIRTDVSEFMYSMLSKLLQRKSSRRPECIDILRAMQMQGWNTAASDLDSEVKIQPLSSTNTPIRTPPITDDEGDEGDEGDDVKLLKGGVKASVQGTERIPSEVSSNRPGSGLLRKRVRISRMPSSLRVEWRHNPEPTKLLLRRIALSLKEFMKYLDAIPFVVRCTLFLIKVSSLSKFLATSHMPAYVLILIALLDFSGYSQVRMSILICIHCIGLAWLIIMAPTV